MRTEFHRQLDDLTANLAAMCELAGAGMAAATAALLDEDPTAAATAVAQLNRLGPAYHDVNRRALALLARQSPVAGDLRTVVSAVHIAASAERMGGLAAHVARTVDRRHPEPVLPGAVRARFAEMGSVADGIAAAAADMVAHEDPDGTARIRQAQERMEALHRGLFGLVQGPEWDHGVGAAVDIVLLGRFYGRFADHAEQISRRVRFRSTGALSA